MKRLWQSAVVMFLTADAMLLLLFDRRWVRFTQFGPPDGIYYRVLRWILKWPEGLLRAVAVIEGALALTLFKRWQLDDND